MADPRHITIDFEPSGETYLASLSATGAVMSLEFHSEAFGRFIDIDLADFEDEEFEKLNAAVKLELAERGRDQENL